jgi:hypothetical protein
MKAVTWCAPYKVSVENVPDPKIINRRDAIVRLTSTCICGSDLHLYDGCIPFMKPGDVMGHGPWSIVEAGQARGRRMTSWPSLQTDLRNAGAVWVDEPAVVDGNLVTSRGPQDIPAFNRAMVELFSHARQPAQAT